MELGEGDGELREGLVLKRDGVRGGMGVLTEGLSLKRDGVRGGMGVLTEVTCTQNVIAHH